MDRVRNEEVRRRTGIQMELGNRVDHIVLRWFGHMERMDECHMYRSELMAEVSGGRVRARPRLGWMDHVMVVLGNTEMTVGAAKQYEKDSKEWRARCIFRLLSFTRPFLLGSCVLPDRLPAPWWVITGRVVECRYMVQL